MQTNTESGLPGILDCVRWALLLLLFSGSLQLVYAVDDQTEGKSDVEPASFYSMTIGRSGFDLVVAQYWSLGARLRSVTPVGGHPIVTLVVGKDYYTYDDLTGTGYVIERSKQSVARDGDRGRPFATDLEEMLEAGGEKVREETLNGIGVDVYRVTNESGRRTLWVTQNSLQLPVKMEGYDRASGRTGELDWLQWIPGLSVPSDFFEPPPDLELRRFGTYEEYLQALAEGPILPSPPLFNYLLGVPGEGE